MGQLAEFVALFTNLEDRVIALDKKDSRLNVEVKSKEARRNFLIKEIKRLVEERNKHIADKAIVAAHSLKAQAEADKKLTDTKNQTAGVTQNHDKTIKNLSDKIDYLKTEIDAVNDDIKTKNGVITKLKQVKIDLTAEIEELNKQLVDKKVEAQQLYEDLMIKKEAFEREIGTIGRDKMAAETQLQKVNTQVQEAEISLAAVDLEVGKANKELIEVNKTAKDTTKTLNDRSKALDVRESVIAEQERQLQVRIITSRRRTSALEK